MTQLISALSSHVGRSGLLDVCDGLLTQGTPIAELLHDFDIFLKSTTTLDAEYEDEVMDVIHILEGFHSPQLQVSAQGIRLTL